jgi:hypothetical protein
MKKENKFYVYAYLDPRKPGQYYFNGLEFCFLFEPFYIGKGNGNRLIHHIRNIKNNIKDVNPRKINKIKKILKEGYELEKFVIKLYNNLSSDFACKLETKIINKIGKLNEKKGSLLNVGDGNNSGCLLKRSEVTKQKLSNSKKGDKNPMYGKIQKTFNKSLEEIYGTKKAKEIKEKLTNSHINKKIPDFTKEKMSNSQKERWIVLKNKETYKPKGSSGCMWKFINPLKEKFVFKGKFDSFCINNNLPLYVFKNIVQNKRKNKFWNGWTVIKIKNN